MQTRGIILLLHQHAQCMCVNVDMRTRAHDSMCACAWCPSCWTPTAPAVNPSAETSISGSLGSRQLLTYQTEPALPPRCFACTFCRCCPPFNYPPTSLPNPLLFGSCKKKKKKMQPPDVSRVSSVIHKKNKHPPLISHAL